MNKTTTDVFESIKKLTKAQGYPPSIREIQEDLSLSSTSVVDYHIKQLVAKGWLVRRPRSSRALTFKETGE